MKVLIRTRHLHAGVRLREYVLCRLQFSLGRFSRRVERVTVHLGDVNGPRGGEDKVCRTVVLLGFLSSILVGAGAWIGGNALLAPFAATLVQLGFSRSRELQPATASHLIVSPLASGRTFLALFSTHPPIEARVVRLRALDEIRGRPAPQMVWER